MATATSVPKRVLDDLVAIVGRDHVVTEPARRASYEVDWTGRFRGSTPAVIRPADTAQVRAVLARCHDDGIAVVPQGGNTGLVGGSVPLDGEIVVSLRRLAGITDDPTARQLIVGAGATLGDAQAAAKAMGLRYAVDLAARDSATIGGTIATNAGGLRFLRYGGTRDQLVGVEAVLADGRVLRHMRGLAKDNTGYDLTRLLCGSEGTLALVTEARLRLVPPPQELVVALVAFADVERAVEAVGAWHTHLAGLDAAELFLDDGLALVCDAFSLPRPLPRAPAYVLVEASAVEEPTDRLAALVRRSDGVVDVAVAVGSRRAADLWRYRDEHTAAINTLGPPHKLDVTIPFDRLATFMASVPGVVAAVAPDARTWLFGHIGDGNIHVNVTGVDPADEARSEAVDGAVLTHAADLGGSISAEHGIGTAKVRWLHLNRSAEEIDVFRSIKRALDPRGILNPNVLLPA